MEGFSHFITEQTGEATFVKSRGFFKSANGITDIACYIYSPKTRPVAAVQIVHGMGEFIERYEELAAFLCENSVAVFGCDHIGHGASVRSDREKGYFFTDKGWQDMIADCRTMFGIGKRLFAGVRLTVYGYSMGSFVARAAITKFGSQMDGAVLCGTGIGLPFAAPVEAAVKAVRAVHGERFRSELVDRLMFGNCNAHIENPRTQSDWLTRDHDEMLKYITDSRRTGVFTINGFENLIRLYEYVSRDRWYDSVEKKLPILLLSGREDPVGEWGRGVEEVYERLRLRGCSVAMKLYDGARHDLIHELDRSQVFEDILKAAVGR